MKRLIFILACIGISFTLFSQELYVPDSYEELKQYYIELASLYQDQKTDLEDAFSIIDTQTKLLEEKTILLEDSSTIYDQQDSIINDKDLEKIIILQRDLIDDFSMDRSYILTLGSSIYYSMEDYKIYLSSNLGVVIKEDYLITIGYLTNRTITIGFNYLF
jgi:hypothetical protein